jgi:hypothetical protein
MLGARMADSAPRVVYDDEGLQIAIWSRVFISRWRKVATLERLAVVGEQQRALVQAMDDGRIAVLTVLEDKSGAMPSGPARKEAEAVAKSVRDAVALQAQVVEGDGFVAASIRALLSGISLAIRAPYPNKVFKTLDEALPWVEEQLRKAGYAQDAAGISAAVRSIGTEA